MRDFSPIPAPSACKGDVCRFSRKTWSMTEKRANANSTCAEAMRSSGTTHRIPTFGAVRTGTVFSRKHIHSHQTEPLCLFLRHASSQTPLLSQVWVRFSSLDKLADCDDQWNEMKSQEQRESGESFCILWLTPVNTPCHHCVLSYCGEGTRRWGRWDVMGLVVAAVRGNHYESTCSVEENTAPKV